MLLDVFTEQMENMNKEDLRIVYMGTPDFAVESLKCLVDGGYNVVGVVTMPDKPMGRHGSVLQPSPVKQYAVEKGLRVLQPEKLKDPAFVADCRSLPYVAGSGVEYATFGHIQSSRFPASSIQRCCSYKLGCDKW